MRGTKVNERSPRHPNAREEDERVVSFKTCKGKSSANHEDDDLLPVKEHAPSLYLLTLAPRR